MSFAALVMRRAVFRLLIIQFTVSLLVASGYLIFQDTSGFLAAMYGGSITLTGTVLMAWRIWRAGEVAGQEKQQGFIEIYAGAIQKFILTLVLMAVGMGYLKLEPLAILVSFTLTQFSYLAIKVDTSY
jgi:ATP synthase protein I